VSSRADTLAEIGTLLLAHWELGGAGVVVAQPPPADAALDPDAFAAALRQAEARAAREGVRGPALTPCLLAPLAGPGRGGGGAGGRWRPTRRWWWQTPGSPERWRPPSPSPAAPDPGGTDMRVLAVGDIHGCSAALDAVLAAAAPGRDDVLVTLGDYVDRGPDSR